MKRIRSLRHRYRKVFITVAIILLILFSLYAVTSGRHYFTRRSVRLIEHELNSFGTLSPVILFGLIVISTLIPPLPIPIPLIEIAAGMMYGFVPGIILVWISQMVSSIAAFALSRYVGKRWLKRFLNNPFINFYLRYIDKFGFSAVFIIRAVIAAPFNISYVAGLSRIRNSVFLAATALGILSEVFVFVYIGTLVRNTRIQLWYIFILLVLLGILPLIASMAIKLMTKSPVAQPEHKKRR